MLASWEVGRDVRQGLGGRTWGAITQGFEHKEKRVRAHRQVIEALHLGAWAMPQSFPFPSTTSFTHIFAVLSTAFPLKARRPEPSGHLLQHQKGKTWMIQTEACAPGGKNEIVQCSDTGNRTRSFADRGQLMKARYVDRYTIPDWMVHLDWAWN